MARKYTTVRRKPEVRNKILETIKSAKGKALGTRDIAELSGLRLTQVTSTVNKNLHLLDVKKRGNKNFYSLKNTDTEITDLTVKTPIERSWMTELFFYITTRRCKAYER